ncbi:MAG TPA: phosphoribosylglycinamide formyltransferase [Caulobacteraceae bacterium]|jgi:formyltetrahydrofolate-dependent phosphoribosylglycinamide formyltransferase|nr:phosphoribosylglycinamide formyltransferase [Caulobacteraceae bacterium]
MNRTRVGILISGRGSDALALIHAAEAADYPAEIALVVSNRPDAPGLRKAVDAGVMALAVDHKPFRTDREAHERAIDAVLREVGVQFVVLAGYMRILTPFFVGAWAGKMVNVHPSLLPAFPGLHSHRQALAAGVKMHGCSVHWVTDSVDAGPIIGQAAVPVLPGDDEETLAARVLAAEHRLFPACVALALGGDQPRPDPSLIFSNPNL